jgi:aspartate racemase
MKVIGLLGGASWVATVPVYEYLNEEVQHRAGGNHSARILLYSIDYEAIKSLYYNKWDEIAFLLKAELDRLMVGQPDCVVMACNTLHKAYDKLENPLPEKVPFFHAVGLTRQALVDQKASKVLFVGTRFTMQDDYFTAPIKQAGVKLVLPNTEEQDQIQAIQCAIVKGQLKPEHSNFFTKLIKKAGEEGCERVIVACTELPIVVTEKTSVLPILDPIKLQCNAALNFALGS